MGHYDDVICEGVDLTRETQPDLAVWRALLATAMSFNGSGRSDIDWLSALDDPDSELGRQSWVKRKVKGKPKRRTPKERRDYLDGIWDKGVARTNASPPGRRPAEIEARANAAMEIVANADLPISDTRRRVLAELARRSRESQRLRVAFSQASVCQATGLNPKAVRLALQWLRDNHLVVCKYKGIGGTAGPSGHAAKYELPEEEFLRARAVTLGTCPVNGTSRPLPSTSRPLPKQQVRPSQVPLGPSESEESVALVEIAARDQLAITRAVAQLSKSGVVIRRAKNEEAS